MNQNLRKETKRKKNRAHFLLNGKNVCRDMFIFSYSISPKRYDLIRKRLNENGVDLMYHGNLKNQHNTTNVFVKQYNWSDWFDSHKFSKIQGIRKLHYFKFDAEKPNFVSVKASLNDEYIDFKLTDDLDLQSFPDELTVPKIPFERKKYLFEKIRIYCHEDSKEILCPDPTANLFVPTATLDTTTRQTPRLRAIGKCLNCKKTGHNKAKCLKKI